MIKENTKEPSRNNAGNELFDGEFKILDKLVEAWYRLVEKTKKKTNKKK